MTDLERELAETLREQAGEVAPDLDTAWAEQRRRRHRPQRRRQVAVWVAPLAAVLVVLTSVLLATRWQSAAPIPPAHRLSEPLDLPDPEYGDPGGLSLTGTPVTEFAGQTDRWMTYAVIGTAAAPVGSAFCLLATPRGQEPENSSPRYGTKSPACVPISAAVVRSGYVGETGGPLPAGKAVYLVDPAVRKLRLFDEEGGLSDAKAVGTLGPDRLFLATVDPDAPPVRFQVS